jgi:hypothetical protein
MRKALLIFTIIFTFVFTAAAQYPATAILKPTLAIRADLDLGYCKMPDAPNYWSWKPEASFTMTGPVEDASFVTFEFTTPDGKPWYSYDTSPISIAAGGTLEIASEGVSSWKDKRSTLQTGMFGFKITLKNNLNGTSKELYSGKFKVGKVFAGTPHPDFKNQWAYYVDHDWTLPMAYVGFSYRDPKSPQLNTGMWLRTDIGTERIAAYVFYNGKQVSSTKNSNTGGAYSLKPIIAEGDDKREAYWSYWNFAFFNLRQFDADRGYPTASLLKNSPGNYEVKILLDGELFRTLSFTIAADGSVVDNGIAAKNGIVGMGTIVPVKIIGTKEGNINLLAWKTEGFYGHPLTGFTAQ